jgi:hypothetical protein
MLGSGVYGKVLIRQGGRRECHWPVAPHLINPIAEACHALDVGTLCVGSSLSRKGFEGIFNIRSLRWGSMAFRGVFS